MSGDPRYGTSISTFVNGGLDPDMRPISGPRVVIESVARGWLTPRGSLITDPNRGEDVRSWIGSDIGPNGDPAKKHALELEALRDPRVEQIDVTLTYDRSTETLRVDATIKLADAATAFDFVLAVSKLTVDLILPKAA